MVDVLALAILVAFFAISVVFVKACERIIGPGVAPATTEEPVSAQRPAA